MTATTSPVLSPHQSSAVISAPGERFRAARRQTMYLCQPLTPEDMMVQSCAEASPAKWHLAHTTWFFESFVLREFLPGYRVFNADFAWLFNSYYESFSAFPEKRLRASFSRPGLDEILRYREHVDEAMERLFEREPEAEALRRIELGANHEEQHQELLLTDILNAFYTNPLKQRYREQGTKGTREQENREQGNAGTKTQPLGFAEFEGGLREAGHAGGGFCFDNELPRHRVWLEPYALADRLVTCGEYAEFMADGGYRRPEFWLSAGWDAVKQNGWRAPLYWSDSEGEWNVFTLRGELPLKELAATPVSQVSFYEADAYARWAGRRLPTEFEWEAAVESQPVEGNFLDSGEFAPVPSTNLAQDQNGTKYYGDCWVWTSSAYLGYPGFHPLDGTLGEYNGKFMSGQMVLRGGSCVTPVRHIRVSYRNFFAPETRWQFSGIRLAK
ncbi:MAG: ergothioneine biosynthesis protein EgtB [Terracidiphilus sp.]|nr:ergothioneine biosynthesis protein EgtB [Terracidiphilus sp.]MDR3798451.1 ergothioneine biosynthesis protein EgtB [Terracidiphilus sp.]